MISQHLILRAILLVPTPDLDLGLWHAVVMEEEEETDQNKVALFLVIEAFHSY
jgi:hypothetical protein